MSLENLKLKFKNIDRVQNFYSQAGQDIFVLCCLDGKEQGIFLDLGCRHPIDINNTYLLEQKFNWTGVSVDIDKNMIDLFPLRDTVALCEDATKLDFTKIKNLAKTNHFDYLSLDLEPASITDACLKSIPFNDIEFSLITYEHDIYRFGEYYRKESRNLLESHGYKRICSNISNEGSPYEDWYYNPRYVSYDRIKVLECENIEWKEALFK